MITTLLTLRDEKFAGNNGKYLQRGDLKQDTPEIAHSIFHGFVEIMHQY
jgi:hypothetical protein